jgi:energy-coupling factor transporter ATP-binding protein EcfA2
VLLRFRVGNYRSIRDVLELSFVATELNEGTARAVHIAPAKTVRVLPVIGLYGPNASGKSNVLTALAHLGRLGKGLLHHDDDTGRTVLGWDPHTFDPATSDQPTHYEAEFLAADVRYVYGLEFTDAAVRGEWLHAYPQGRRQVWFERDRSAPESLRFPDNHLGPAQSTLADLARPDRPFISLANEIRHAKLAPVADWFASVSSLTPPERSSPMPMDGLAKIFIAEQGTRVVDMLRRADSSIEGVEFVSVEPSERDQARGRTEPRREVRLRHRGRAGTSLLPLRLESDGTRAWLRMLRPLLQTLESGGVLVLDELDGSLHPELAAETIRMFYDLRLNRRGAQLVFSSHDVSMLSTVYGRPLLDRDQVWFTEKDGEGATELYPLSELKPRKGENIERGYLSGRYGAVPGLSPGELARSLWPDDDGSE